jgi:hypothetical protein
MWPVTPALVDAILSPVHTVAIKAQVLDTDFNVVEGGEFYSTGTDRYIQNYIVDGSVDVDVSRSARRTFTMQLLNPDAQFSPGSDWGGLFYVDRLIRIYRGVDFGTSEEYVPLGTFFIDHADVIVERNMSIVVLSGSDGWKKLTKSQNTRVFNFGQGTPIDTVITALAGMCGVTRFVFDDLTSRTADAKTLNKPLVVEKNQKVGEVVAKLGVDFGLDIFFDPLGRLATQDFSSPVDQATVWTYAPGETNNLLSVRATYSDDSLYNDSVVIATGDKDHLYVGQKSDTDPNSPTNINSIGRRTLLIESDSISTQAAADVAARKQFYTNILVSEDITLEAICNPAFEGNDIIAVKEATYTKVNRRYRIRSFSVPLASSRQVLKLQRAVDV